MTRERPHPLDSSRLLATLREATGEQALVYSMAPRRVGMGGEAVVDAFELDAAPAPFEGPLVLRRLIRAAPYDQVRREQAVHRGLLELGFPVPRVPFAEPDPARLGAPFAVMQRLLGHPPLEEVGRPGELLARPGRLPGLVVEAAARIPDLLGGTQSRLHALDPEGLRAALRGAGIDPGELGFEARLAELGSRIRGASLEGLEPGLSWLREHRPRETRPVICHGDFVFTNLFVENGRVGGVIDWSKAAIAPPEYDVAGTLARITSTVAGVPRALATMFRLVQAQMARRYRRSYSRLRAVDATTLDYFDAFWLLWELACSGERLREGDRPDGRIESRWLHAEAIRAGAARFQALAGVEIRPLEPGAAAGRR